MSPLSSNETFLKNIYPTNIYIHIAQVFTIKNTHLPQHAFTPSAIQALLHQEIYFGPFQY